ncbi:MAG: BTAD domain-containing putative transcriptional regulator [Solirubrobacteraceae bacterium]
MQFRLLGPMDVLDRGTALALGGLKQRALLARLLVTANRTVSVDRLVDDLWGDAVPDTAVKMVQIYVSQLRKLLPADVLLTRPPGYLVQVHPEAIDIGRFDRLRRTGRAALEAGEPATASSRLRDALGLWRGEALAEFAEPFAQAERNHLHELRLACLEDRIEAELMQGRHAELVGELAAEVARLPLRERLQRQWMLALYRSGRHADALAVYEDFRRTLDDDLGLEPSLQLRELQGLILNQDPSLELQGATRTSRVDDVAGRRNVRAGFEALGRGAWDDAKAAFERALADGEEAEALEGWAQAARFLGEGDASLDARARAFRAYRGRGDSRAAARTAAWLAYDTVVFRGDDAVAQGWFRHAHRLLTDGDEAEEHGWLAFLEGEVALVAHGDAARAAEHAAQALEVGRRTGAMDLEMLGLSLIGLARVAAGQIAEGMRELDQATAAAVAGELSGLHFAGAVCCHMIYACERVHDVERATQWCETVRGFSEEWSVPQLFGFCRAHYASVLIWRGQWNDAEAELTAASRAFERGAPALVYESILRLAELRRRQSRLEEANELCQRVAWHPAAQLCLAEIALDRGDAQGARDLVARHLRALPHGERLGRASGLELTVRVHLAMEDIRAAEAGVKDLQELADAAGTAPLRASVRFSRGLVARARGDPAEAKRDLEDAVDLWSRMRVPYELARGRIALAELALQTGRAEEATRELRHARAALHGLAAPSELERADAMLARAHADSLAPVALDEPEQPGNGF